MLLIAAAGALPLIVQGYWVGLIAQAFAYAVIFCRGPWSPARAA